MWGQVLCREKRSVGWKVRGIGSDLGEFQRGDRWCVVMMGGGGVKQ